MVVAIFSITMRTIKRFFLGALSCALLALGFAQAADHVDPMIPTHSIDARVNGTAADTVTECWIDDNQG